MSKGYGFINCENKKTYDRILGIKTHLVRDRMVEINHAVKRNGDIPEDIQLKSLRKLFVGGLGSETSRDHLVEHFSHFGEIANAYIIYDPLTKLSKNFGYVEFQSPDGAKIAASSKEHFINGKKASVQFFKTKESQRKLVTNVQEYPERSFMPKETMACPQRVLMGKMTTDNSSFYPQVGFGVQFPRTLNYPQQFSATRNPDCCPKKSSSPQRQGIVRPFEGQKVPQRAYLHFYQALKNVDTSRDFQSTYSRENLRLNRLKKTIPYSHLF